MRYLLSRMKSDRAERIYRIYVTDSLFYQARGGFLKERYVDILDKKPQETRKAEDIISDVTSRLGIKVE